MAQLGETENVTLKCKCRTADGSEFYEIPAIGDGNCAYNAFALGLIGAIKRGHQIDDDVLKAFIELIRKDTNLAILKQRVALYRGQNSRLTGNQYTDLADKLENFISLWNANDANLIGFILHQNSRIEIAALHVALAPALRDMAINKLFADKKISKQNIEILKRDETLAGNFELEALAPIFNININLCRTNIPGKIDVQPAHAHIDDAPELFLLYIEDKANKKDNHWNLLVTPEQKAPFANLPDLTTTPKSSVSNAPLKALDSSSKISEWLNTNNKLSQTSNPQEKINAARAQKFRQANKSMNTLLDKGTSKEEFQKAFDALSTEIKNMCTPRAKL